MANTEKHIHYWHKGAVEDFAVGADLVAGGRARHGLFFAHLALEKILKAHVCRQSGPMVPKSHDLVRLSSLSGLSLSAENRAFLARFGRYQIEGRYPELLEAEPSKEIAAAEIRAAEELLSFW